MLYESPIIVGSGLVALDLVLPKDAFTPEKVSVGGSCGNVMSTLAWLGWRSFPVATVSEDLAGETVRRCLEESGVSTDALVPINGGTPIIVHRYGLGQPGDPRHRWEWTCPVCSRPLPRYKPIAAKRIPALSVFGSARAFYFDRATPAALVLAKIIKAEGGVVFFEPPKLLDTSIFRRCLSHVDVLKVSGEVVERGDLENIAAGLIIRTLGSRGLEYKSESEAKWNAMPAFSVDKAVDTAGCGDWLSASFIYHHLGKRSTIGSGTEVRESLRFAQAVAAISSLFVGSRGMMESMDSSDLVDSAVQFSTSGSVGATRTRPQASSGVVNYACPLFC